MCSRCCVSVAVGLDFQSPVSTYNATIASAMYMYIVPKRAKLNAGGSALRSDACNPANGGPGPDQRVSETLLFADLSSFCRKRMNKVHAALAGFNVIFVAFAIYHCCKLPSSYEIPSHKA